MAESHDGGAVVLLNAAEARELTDRINTAADNLCGLLYEAHERQAWRALGYASWREYATAELRVSQSHAYRRLDQGRVIAAITEAAGFDSPMGEILTERAAREIKPALHQVTETIRTRVAAGESPALVVPEVVQAHRPPKAAKPEPAPEPEDDAPDLADELRRAMEENERLAAENASLASTDLHREVRSWSAKYAQLNAVVVDANRRANEAKRQAEYGTKMLRKIREALGVEKDSEILTAIYDLGR